MIKYIYIIGEDSDGLPEKQMLIEVGHP